MFHFFLFGFFFFSAKMTPLFLCIQKKIIIQKSFLYLSICSVLQKPLVWLKLLSLCLVLVQFYGTPQFLRKQFRISKFRSIYRGKKKCFYANFSLLINPVISVIKCWIFSTKLVMLICQSQISVSDFKTKHV